MADGADNQNANQESQVTKPAKQETGTSSTGAKSTQPGDLGTKEGKGTSSTGARGDTVKGETRVIRKGGSRGRE